MLAALYVLYAAEFNLFIFCSSGMLKYACELPFRQGVVQSANVWYSKEIFSITFCHLSLSLSFSLCLSAYIMQKQKVFL